MKYTLNYKITIMVLLILLGFVSCYSQVSELMTHDFTSPNKDFWITVKGLAYEGYTGKQEITLKNRDDHILWKKKESIWSTPIVSNLGIVALLGSEVRFFDSTGNKIGSYKPNYTLERFWTGCVECPPGQAFSPDGKKYYTMIDSEENQCVISLTNTGKERWRFILKPDTMQDKVDAEGFIVFSGGVLTYYSVYYPSGRSICYLLSDGGQVITTFRSKLRDLFYSIKIYDSQRVFTIAEGDSLKTYSLETGSFLASKYFESKATRAKRINK